MTAFKRLAIWRSSWLPSSETFVRNHADSLTEWEAICVGVEKRESGISRVSDIVLFSDVLLDRWARRLFIRSGYSWRLYKFLKEGDFRLVHAHFGIDAVQVGPMCRLLGIPLVITLHGVDVTAAAERKGVAGAIYRRRLRRTLQHAALVLAVSKSISERALRLGAPPERLRIHYLGLPLIRRHEASVSCASYDVLLVGRLVEKKGVPDLLRAIGILANRGLDIGCGIVGAGPLETQLIRQAEVQCPGHVDFLGLKTPDEVVDLMRASRIVVVPSRTAQNGDTEGLPTVILEAAAAGRTVAAYAHGGIPEVVAHGVSGLLCPEGDVEKLADNIARLLSDTSLREQLERNARSRIVQDFDIEKQAKALQSLYDIAVGG